MILVNLLHSKAILDCKNYHIFVWWGSVTLICKEFDSLFSFACQFKCEFLITFCLMSLLESRLIKSEYRKLKESKIVCSFSERNAWKTSLCCDCLGLCKKSFKQMFPGHWKLSSLSINRKFVFYYQLGRPVGIINCSICTVKVVNILLPKDFSCISRLCLAWKVQRLIWLLSMAVMNHNLWWLPAGRNIIYIMIYHSRLYLLVGICAIAKSYLGTESACATILHSRWTMLMWKTPKEKK